jgi:hypothetical protein
MCRNQEWPIDPLRLRPFFDTSAAQLTPRSCQDSAQNQGSQQSEMVLREPLTKGTSQDRRLDKHVTQGRTL